MCKSYKLKRIWVGALGVWVAVGWACPASGSTMKVSGPTLIAGAGKNGNSSQLGGWPANKVIIDFGECKFSGDVSVWSNGKKKTLVSKTMNNVSGRHWENMNDESSYYNDVSIKGELRCNGPVPSSLYYEVSDRFGWYDRTNYSGRIKLDVTTQNAAVQVVDEVRISSPKGSKQLVDVSSPHVAITVRGGEARVPMRREGDGAVEYVSLDGSSGVLSWNTDKWQSGKYTGSVTLVGTWR